MEAPQDLPEPQILADLLGVVVKLFAAFGAIILGGMSYVWSVARSAKRCAFDARLKVERADAVVEMVRNELAGLRADQAAGFKGVHTRLDRHMDKH